MSVSSRNAMKWTLWIVLPGVIAVLSAHMAHCGDLVCIVWDPGNSHPGLLARFYFLVLMGIAVLITQNCYIRTALRRIDERENRRG